jgi:hypothetical protein
VLFDSLSYGSSFCLPFVVSNLEFFNEFASKGLGITTDRNVRDFSKGLASLDKNYDKYTGAVGEFSKT